MCACVFGVDVSGPSVEEEGHQRIVMREKDEAERACSCCF
jgi:hypothetical protein